MAGRRTGNRVSGWWNWIAFFTSALVAIAFFFVPALIIRPFAYQAPRALWIAMAMRQHAPLVAAFAGLICLAFAYALWKPSNWWRTLAIAVVVLVAGFAATMSRLNYFEWMFHPIDSPQFVAQLDSKLDAKEMVLAVNFEDDARAYPISQMAYHHVLNDVVAGVPIAVTY
jgi:Protein of unknown function (DUF3179)